MKVVVSGYIGKKITGIGRNLENLLNNSKGTIQYIVYTNYDMLNEFDFTNKNVEMKTYNVSKNSSMKNLLWTTFVFPFKVLHEKADIALIPNFTLLLLKFKPTVVIMHDLIEFNVPNKFSKLKMFYRTKLADPITAKMSNKIITVSQNSKRDIVKYLNVKEDRIAVVYNGVDTKKFHKMEEQKASEIIKNRNWPTEFILYAGTIDHPGKNAMNVIKAYEKLVQRKVYDGKLILAGMPGSGFEEIEHYIQKSEYKEGIVLTGYVTDEELIALYSMCKAFCFFSLYEGFGIPPLEALACGAKVIVSDSSALPEVVGSVGVTVNPLDVDAIADSILTEMQGRNNKNVDEVKKHIEQYDWKKLSAEFEEVLINVGK